jgi:heptaprenyl diphosphate synthase
MAFQIKDDVLDMQGKCNVIGKPVGSDLAQGIITLPTIFALQTNNTSAIKLTKLINGKFSNGQEDLDEAIAIIKANDGLKKSLLISKRYIIKAKEQLKFLPECSTKTSLEQIADYINEREF